MTSGHRNRTVSHWSPSKATRTSPPSTSSNAQRLFTAKRPGNTTCGGTQIIRPTAGFSEVSQPPTTSPAPTSSSTLLRLSATGP
ncbi:hypothetical protein ASPCAL15043 [Aspergillus calidoustus]|uniref:Uncharacterized protein n=1 Tax=Aspergillus calidoustus TaxID=454130 RepID=A0A0U5GKR5_ASPCI|nr:hypothetical protein ASPCAL15043 [Aspergillus calidoustus]